VGWPAPKVGGGPGVDVSCSAVMPSKGVVRPRLARSLFASLTLCCALPPSLVNPQADVYDHFLYVSLNMVRRTIKSCLMDAR